MSTFIIKRGDQLPIVSSTLSDANGPVDLTGASVQFIMLARNRTVKINAPAFIDYEEGGLVSYEWALGDTDTLGVYSQEWEVTFADGTRATFPNDDFNYVAVLDDLADA